MSEKEDFEHAETFDELYDLIKDELDWGMCDWATLHARNAYLRLRRKYIEFEIPETRQGLLEICDDCTSAIRIIHKSDELKGESNGGNVSGMRWQDVQEKAERIVDESEWQGFGKLRKAVGGCSKNTLRKAVDDSGKLKEAEAQYKSMSGTLKAVGLTSKTLAIYGKSSEEKLPSETEANEILDELLRQTKKEKPKMFEEIKKKLDEMDSESRQKLASAYKNKTLGEDPKKPRQYKEV